jgi:hypothetical protein
VSPLGDRPRSWGGGPNVALALPFEFTRGRPCRGRSRAARCFSAPSPARRGASFSVYRPYSAPKPAGCLTYLRRVEAEQGAPGRGGRGRGAHKKVCPAQAVSRSQPHQTQAARQKPSTPMRLRPRSEPLTVTLQARGIEADSKLLGVQITWDGEGSYDADEMAGHMVLKPLSPSRYSFYLPYLKR